MKTSILMVCLGNICRSPLAEGILKSKLPPERFYVDSAGTANYHAGNRPDVRSIAVAEKYGINITTLKSRQFKVSDFDLFEFIYVMDQSNHDSVVKLARNQNDVKKVALLLNEVTPNENLEVPDPYYGGTNGFERVYNMLNTACTALSKKLNP